MEKVAKKLSIGTLVAASLFCLLYVVYAHVASWNEMRRFLTGPIDEHFSSEASLSKRFKVVSRGPIEYEIDSHLRVAGSTGLRGGKLSRLELIGPVYKLQESEISLRLQMADTGSYDLGFGVASSKHISGDRLLGTIRNQKKAGLLIKGNTQGSSGNDLSECNYRNTYQNISAFDLFGKWVNLTLRISPVRHVATISADGRMIGTCSMDWKTGKEVRLLLSLTGRSPGQRVDLKIEKFSYRPLPEPLPATDIVESFKGEVLDPAIWSVISFLQARSRQNVELIEGKGLLISGENDQTNALLAVDSRLMSLQSFDAILRFEPIIVNNCRLFLGWANPWRKRSFARTYKLFATMDAGLVSLYSSAHINGQIVKRQLGRWPSQTFEVRMNYDGKERLATIDVNDVRQKMKIDLSPGEPVRFSIGGVCWRDSAFKLRVASVEIRHSQLPQK